MVIHSPCGVLWFNCKAFIHVKKRPPQEDTDDEASEADSTDAIWDFYQERGPTEAQLTRVNSGPRPGKLERRSTPGQTHCWDAAPWQGIGLRSATYLKNGVKEPTLSPLLEPVIVELHEAASPLEQKSRPEAIRLRAANRVGPNARLFLLDFNLGTAQLLILFATPTQQDEETSATPAGRLLERFISNMSNEDRTNRLKLLPKVLDGPWLVSASIPTKPTIIARQCSVVFKTGTNYIQASVDCAGSTIGKKIAKVLTGGQCDLALYVLLEGQCEDELPERLVGAIALHRTVAPT